MASIIINSSCNLRCPFCFATESRSDEEVKRMNMNEKEFEKYLAFDNNIVTSLCGGEPTLHPKFTEYMDKMLSIRGKYINLLTNGLWNENVCEYIKNLDFNKSKRIMYLFNVLNPKLYTSKQYEMLNRSLSCINPETAYVGFTIYNDSFDYSYIFDIAKKYNISRIRYSVASPNVTDKRSWSIDPKKDFKKIASIVHNFVMEAVSKGFEVNADCGYLPPCAYTKEQLADLLLIENAVNFKCSSVGDIDKEGNTWRCYGLYSVMNKKIDEFNDVQEMKKYYDKEAELLLSEDIFDECVDCVYKEREICNGGCLAYRAINKIKNGETINCNVLSNKESILKLIPRINKRVLKIWNKSEDEKYIYIRKHQKMQVQLLKNKEELINLLKVIDGKRNIQEIINELSFLYENQSTGEAEIIKLIKSLYFNDCLKMSK